ncbi:MAG TPA: tRNA preQ1(34) S-adenosylmethionine ribosyltransferase-isomerase QueA [Verrucomicrobiae bacterium]|nr:tRNA preQ1(34) S-adenosylmethionine ribosyltransferase-isomerase QueA [Verrucomicrobiae bacterium]
MKTSDFDYDLPPELIAQAPLADRAGSRMLVVNRATGQIQHDHFRNLGTHLRPGDLLVLNDTKVIPARIWSSDPVRELLLIENLGNGRWSALVKPLKKAKRGSVLKFADDVQALVETETDFGGRVLQFTGDLTAFLAAHGAAPLPPYIKRSAPDAGDLERYQTVFARQPGAVAAPTAGLHFTSELLRQLDNSGVAHAFLTLHVGIGTFRPVKTENLEEHKMHAERFSIPAATVEAMSGASRVIAVGTTVVRALESLRELRAGDGQTNLFIRPPFQFRYVDALLTNFHLPRSTLLMLVCAFASRELVLRAYEEAVRERYRFFSYGDCMLVL